MVSFFDPQCKSALTCIDMKTVESKSGERNGGSPSVLKEHLTILEDFLKPSTENKVSESFELFMMIIFPSASLGYGDI